MTPIIKVVLQRGKYDCAVAALAMLTGQTYEEILLAVGQEQPKVLTKGLWITEIMRIAKAAGIVTKCRKTFDLDTDYGLLCLYDHVVVLKNGLVIDPTDGSVWEADVYLATARETAPRLLQPKE